MPGQVAGNGALARAGRSVDGDDDLAAGLNGADAAFFRTHPRFFVPWLGRSGKAVALAVAGLGAGRQSRLAAGRVRSGRRYAIGAAGFRAARFGTARSGRASSREAPRALRRA